METAQFIQSLKARLSSSYIEAQLSEASKATLVGYESIDRYYNNSVSKYKQSEIKHFIEHASHAIPFTARHLGMLKYLAKTVGFSMALSAIDDMKPFNYSSRSLRQIVARYKGRERECSLLEFMYDYSSVFCLRGDNYDSAFLDLQINTLKMKGVNFNRIDESVEKRIISTWRDAIVKPSYAELGLYNGVSKATAYRIVKKYLKTVLDTMTSDKMYLVAQQYHKLGDIEDTARATGTSYNQVYAVVHDMPNFKK